MALIMTCYKSGDGTVNIELLRFLGDWLSKHILREDKGYGTWLSRTAVK